jgi:hypothetical protein
MDEFLTSIQQSGFARFIGESGSKWGYPFVLFMHTLGLGIVAGVSAGIALRVLGFGRGVAIESFDRLFPIMWFGIHSQRGVGPRAARDRSGHEAAPDRVLGKTHSRVPGRHQHADDTESHLPRSVGLEWRDAIERAHAGNDGALLLDRGDDGRPPHRVPLRLPP